jgi:two-component system nitrogen regulation sensor histidine kinase NtrY
VSKKAGVTSAAIAWRAPPCPVMVSPSRRYAAIAEKIVGRSTLAPVSSMAATCKAMLQDDDIAAVERVIRALDVIERRSASLGGFIAAYARLARISERRPAPVALGDVIRRIAAMDTRWAVRVIGAAETTVLADESLLEQALVNLVRNAIDAEVTTEGTVTIDWRAEADEAHVLIADDGPGIENPENLFVPLFSTNPTAPASASCWRGTSSKHTAAMSGSSTVRAP